MTKYIQIIDFVIPHNTGLVFEVEKEFKEYYIVKQIFSNNGEKLSADGYNKSVCLELKNDIEYINILLERTRLILEFQKDK